MENNPTKSEVKSANKRTPTVVIGVIAAIVVLIIVVVAVVFTAISNNSSSPLNSNRNNAATYPSYPVYPAASYPVSSPVKQATLPKPVISAVDENFISQTDIQITDEEPGVLIYYTLGYADPDGFANPYSKPFHIDRTTDGMNVVVKAKAFRNNEESEVAVKLFQLRKYSLVLDGQYSIPGTGVTYDGTYLWLIAGGYNSLDQTLVQYDLATFTIKKSFALDNLLESLGTGAYGIDYFNNSIWISVAGNTNKIVRVDLDTGKIIKTIRLSDNLGKTDLYIQDANTIYVSGGRGLLYVVNPSTGKVADGVEIDKKHRPFPPLYDVGIASYEGNFWIGDSFMNSIKVYDKNLNLIDQMDGIEPGMMKILPNNKLAMIKDGKLQIISILK